MAELTYFTVEGDFRSVVADVDSDLDADPNLSTVTATVTFRPLIADGDVILATDASPRPTGFVAAPVVARIDSDGRLKLRVTPDGTREAYGNVGLFPATGSASKYYVATDTGTHYRWTGSAYAQILSFTPVRLLADTPVLELAGPLFYSVTFTNVQFNGRAGTIRPFNFQAPNSDSTINLIEVGRAPGQQASGVTKIAPTGVRFENDEMIFTFGGVDIPDPLPLGDITGPVGPQGPAATVAVGSVSTGAPGSSATVTNSGSSGAAVLDFAIPRGDVGATGAQGEIGPAGTTSWNGLTDKPAVIAAGATQADARTAIGAGTSSLEIGTSASTAKRGDYAPTSNEITTALGFTPESAANKNQASGYAGLDSSGLVPASLLPGFVDDVVEAANLAAFPATGTSGKLYVALDTSKVWRWSGSTYIEVSPSPSSTDAVPEGSVNQYFTAVRAQSALTSQLAGKSDVGHTHSQSDVSGLSTSLAGKSDVGHGHVESDITGLTAALGAKQSTSEKNQPSGYAGLDSSSRVTQDGVSVATAAASEKTTPVDADVVPLVDSAASNVLKKLSWANIKATFAAYYDALATTLSNKTLASPALTGTAKGATGASLELYNTADQVTNYERGRLYWNSNILTLSTDIGGTGSQRSITLTAGGSTVTLSNAASSRISIGPGNASTATTMVVLPTTFTSASLTQNQLSVSPTINQSGTAGYTALLINPTETATGSGTKRLIDAQVGGTSRFTVDNAGNVAASGTVQANGNQVETVNRRGAANGYASLDSNGKVPGSQLPNSIMTYEGLHDVSANTPALTDAGGDAGQVYRVSVAGSRDYGSGSITLGVGDYLIHNGTAWEKADTTDAVSTVNGYTGNITLTKADVGLGNVDNTSDATKNAASVTLTNKTIDAPALTGTAKGATGASLELYNTADQVTNYERGRLYWNSNILTLSTDIGGTGSQRSITLTAGGSTVTLSNAASSRISIGPGNASTATTMVVLPTTFTSASLTQNQLSVSPTINQSGTASYTCLLINPTETTTGSGTKRLIDAQVSGSSKLTVDNTGLLNAVGGVQSNGVTVPTISSTSTFTNKRVDPRLTVAASASSLTPDISAADMYAYTALAADLTINAPTGTPVGGNMLRFRLKDNGTGRALTWNSIFRAIGVTIPTTTVANKLTYVTALYNATDTKWDVIQAVTEA